jgi:Host cell surface-exposed lipoprotein
MPPIPPEQAAANSAASKAPPPPPAATGDDPNSKPPAANEYLATTHFSRAGLIEQLSPPYGSQFTRAEATYAADKVGL